ncbi:hypothetical protein KIN20_024392 [Parelaphostrongylus tenuis]|uniref:Uncharacterized protein n=1 Tax=Parelaphostrongylus tenuis TaxID=148309 RepID=A0AAD5QTM4_PARTN|nr:hypothetical protein KIN20_024392 [Parelaphostrongylus tenuis]
MDSPIMQQCLHHLDEFKQGNAFIRDATKVVERSYLLGTGSGQAVVMLVTELSDYFGRAIRQAGRCNRTLPRRRLHSLILLQETSKLHIAKLTKRMLIDLCLELLNHPAYNPDLAPD